MSLVLVLRAELADRAVLDPNIETSEGFAPPVFGFALPSPDGRLNWRALLAESGALVASQYDPIAFLDNTRTDTQVTSAYPSLPLLQLPRFFTQLHNKIVL